MKVALGASLLDGAPCGMRSALCGFLDEVRRQGLASRLELIHSRPFAARAHPGYRDTVIHRGNVSGGGLVWSQLSVPRLVRHADYDLVHWPEQILPPMRSPKPLVVSVWDLAPMSYREPGWNRLAAGLKYGIVLAHALRKAEAIIAHSHATADEICERFAIDKARVRVIYPGLPPRFEAETDTLHRPNPDGPILCVGNNTPRKNLKLLMEAFALVARHGYPHKLAMRVSDDPQHRARLLEFAARCGAPVHRICFVDRLQEEEMIQLYRSASVLAFPSLYEGFGLPLIEAMACGVPVVALNRSAMPEVVGDAGQLVAESDPERFAAAIERLLEGDESMRMEQARRSKNRARRFRWFDAVSKTFAVYEELAGARCGSSAGKLTRR